MHQIISCPPSSDDGETELELSRPLLEAPSGTNNNALRARLLVRCCAVVRVARRSGADGFTFSDRFTYFGPTGSPHSKPGGDPFAARQDIKKRSVHFEIPLYIRVTKPTPTYIRLLFNQYNITTFVKGNVASNKALAGFLLPKTLPLPNTSSHSHHFALSFGQTTIAFVHLVSQSQNLEYCIPLTTIMDPQYSPADSMLSASCDNYQSLFSEETTASPAELALTPQSMKSDREDSVMSMSQEGADTAQKKPTKKRKSWGQELPTPTTNLGPR